MANHGAQITEHMKRHQTHLERLQNGKTNAVAEAVRARTEQQQRAATAATPQQEVTP
jgi:hypothetical protein